MSATLNARFPDALPGSRVPDSRDAPPLRWGIAGPGWIAERFAASLQQHTRQIVAAVGSRSQERSRDFAGRFSIPAAYGSYEELAAAPDVDIVYVATPHNHHHAVARLALEAGKHVLIEKPIGINARQAEDIAALAEARGLLAAEALWTFFLPKYDVVRQLLDAGALGQLVTVLAEYGEHFEPGHRIFDPKLAGGPLLDLGTYPLAFISSVLGLPETVHAVGTPHPAGVNGQISAVMDFAGGVHAVISTNLYGFTPTTATIVGTEATLTLDGPFNAPGGFTVRTADGRELRYEEPPGDHVAGLHFQAAAVARAIAAGGLEVAERPLAESIKTMRLADELRGQLGISFPDGQHAAATASHSD
ncbi:Gfo/Idh/MocA family protein [Arthrobacter crystallopoietes]|uniref:Predicted dehydrogenase n=1 Tax=Crystallibacter crystallopoietes TaxID=37928 RepID=A0A1H0ZGF2_9MICC|nr:Gfo/Idh/MocA family oxidoreductase [Arthrobacter crystallopoietes]AUI51995.1 oxidoreductase [Arthrobacter crystallopoietes]SDQ26464.1 Predicted dehydrogenase [Arthrobacter crystallopoietes]